MLNNIHKVVGINILLPFLIWKKGEVDSSLLSSIEEWTCFLLQVVFHLDVPKVTWRCFNASLNNWIDFCPHRLSSDLSVFTLKLEPFVELLFKNFKGDLEWQGQIRLDLLFLFLVGIRSFTLTLLLKMLLELSFFQLLFLVVDFFLPFILSSSTNVIHGHDLVSKLLNLLIKVNVIFVMRIDHHHSSSILATLLTVPSEVWVHANDVSIWIPREEWMI